MAAQLSPEQLRAMLPVLVTPVARAAEDRSGKVHGAVKEMAAEALQHDPIPAGPQAAAPRSKCDKLCPTCPKDATNMPHNNLVCPAEYASQDNAEANIPSSPQRSYSSPSE